MDCSPLRRVVEDAQGHAVVRRQDLVASAYRSPAPPRGRRNRRGRWLSLSCAGLGLSEQIEIALNPGYEEGGIVTLWSVREALGRSGDVILMDSDVLYDFQIAIQSRRYVVDFIR